MFGDSLSDRGNVYLLTGSVSTAPYDVIPSAPYDIRGPGMAFLIMSDAITATAGNIQRLYAAGARDFLVANVPNLGLAPAIAGLGLSSQASYLVSIYNGLLEGALQQLDAAPGIAQ